ncbi:MAG: hypothetical protein ACRD2L_23075 [Terriglobia bacterium]
MDILRSSRHAKVAGNFGETLVLYWLSKYGFECASVDHTGIDLIARNPHTQELMGISVKSRTRSEGREQEYVSILRGDLVKAQVACDAFGCVAYFAIVIDAKDLIRVFITSKQHLLELFPLAATKSGWKMRERYLTQYYEDPEIKIFQLRASTPQWWQPTNSSRG